MKLIHCQWDDLLIPKGYAITTKSPAELAPSERENVEIYMPKYMGGAAALSAIADFPNLKLVQLLMAGYEDALPHMRKGVRLCNARGVHDQSTAELGVALLASYFLGIKSYLKNMEIGKWDGARRDSLYSKKVAIVGAGSVGTRIKEMLDVFKVESTFFARSARQGVFAISELEQRISGFDAVVLVLPLTSETRHLITLKELSSMKPGGLLVNLARGPVVKTDDLLVALKRGKISAALDVTDPEPLPSDHELWHLANVIITPHVGGNSNAFEPQAREFLEEQLERYVATGQLINEIEF
jgi:phosphoglycerate dehydrogenase-like enzyme